MNLIQFCKNTLFYIRSQRQRKFFTFWHRNTHFTLLHTHIESQRQTPSNTLKATNTGGTVRTICDRRALSHGHVLLHPTLTDLMPRRQWGRIQGQTWEPLSSVAY